MKEKDDKREIPKDGRSAVAALSVGFVSRNHQLKAEIKRHQHAPDQFTLLLGRRYNRTKKAAHGRADRDFSEDQIDTPKTNTAATLGEEYGVSEATVKRAGQYADAVAKRRDTREGSKRRRTHANGQDVAMSGPPAPPIKESPCPVEARG